MKTEFKFWLAYRVLSILTGVCGRVYCSGSFLQFYWDLCCIDFRVLAFWRSLAGPFFLCPGLSRSHGPAEWDAQCRMEIESRVARRLMPSTLKPIDLKPSNCKRRKPRSRGVSSEVRDLLRPDGDFLDIREDHEILIRLRGFWA